MTNYELTQFAKFLAIMVCTYLGLIVGFFLIVKLFT